jgi:hypothetical protein
VQSFLLLRIEKSLHRCMPLTFFFLGRKSRQSKKREPVWTKQRKGTFPPRKQLGSPRATMLGSVLGAVIREKNTRGREASNSLFFNSTDWRLNSQLSLFPRNSTGRGNPRGALPRGVPDPEKQQQKSSTRG